MPAGRPPILTRQKQEKLAELFWLAFTDQQCAEFLQIDPKTIWRIRQGKMLPAIKIAEIAREMEYRKKIWNGNNGNWQGIAWFLERKYPTQFARPEIQLSVNNNLALNALSINIGKDEFKVIEAAAEPVRAAVQEMFKTYRPELGNGHGNGGKDTEKTDDTSV